MMGKHIRNGTAFRLAAATALIAGLLGQPAAALADPAILLKPDRVFTAADESAHPGWQVLLEGNLIKAVGPALKVPRGTQTVDLPGTTLLPD